MAHCAQTLPDPFITSLSGFHDSCSGPDVGLVGPHATVIVGPQPPHSPTISRSCYFMKRVPRYRNSTDFVFINLGGPLSPGAPSTASFASM